MAVHPEVTPSEAADRLAIRELFDAYAHCADRRDAEAQKALFTVDTRFAVYMDGEGQRADLRAGWSRSPHAGLRRSESLRGDDPLQRAEHGRDRRAPAPTAESYTITYVYAEDGRRKIMIASLRYLDTFAKIDRAWFFAERNLIVDWSETRWM